MKGVGLCALCEDTVLSPVLSSFATLHGKCICASCISVLSTSTSIRSPPNPGPCQTFNIKPGLPLICLLDQQEGNFYCKTCDAITCEQCGNVHATHTKTAVNKARLRLERKLTYVHYLATHNARIDARNAMIIAKNVEEVYTRMLSCPEENFLLSLSKLHDIYSELIKLDTSLWGLKPQFNYHLLRQLPYPQPLCSCNIHWVEWSGCSLHLYNVQTRTMLSQQIADASFIVPLYSRTVHLGGDTLFLCGGREALDSKGIRKCWFLRISDWNLQVGPDSLLGHANHSVQLFENTIYVLGGCDHDNSFTNECESLDLSLSQWSLMPSMQEIRDSVASLVDKRARKIYAFGGRLRANTCHDTIEMYVIDAKQWYILNVYLPYKIYMHGVAQLPYDGRILLFGGLTENDAKTGRATLINLSTESAIEIASMPSSGCITDEVRVIGKSVLVSVFYGYASRQINQLDLETLSWQLLS